MKTHRASLSAGLRVRFFFVASLMLAACSSSSSITPRAQDSGDTGVADMNQAPVSLRVASFNTSLFRDSAGGLVASLAGGGDEQARRVAEVIQRNRPDIVLLNEFDWDENGSALKTFQDEYLAVAQGGAEAIQYDYAWAFESNTGVASGFDLDNDGTVVSEPGSREYGGDAFGYGVFEGQYGFVVLSRFPAADPGAIREFKNFPWASLPDNVMPEEWFTDEERTSVRLSSKNHVDLPLVVEGRTVHLLASHPTPPAFDGPEDRNGRRNADEVRFWVEYLSEGRGLVDDRGGEGPLAAGEHFVIVGDLNLDPTDGDSRHEAMEALLGHSRVSDPGQRSTGAVEAAEAQGQANLNHSGDSALDTADFSDGAVGNLRVDYALPSSTMPVVDSGVFWPADGEPHAELADVSDHHLVWVDVEIP